MFRHPGLARRSGLQTPTRMPRGRRLSTLAAGLMVALAMVAGTPVRAAVPPPTLTVTTTSLPSGQMPNSYTASLSAINGVTPYSWTLTAGSLPPGLTLSPAGVIGGTPSVAGTWSGLVFGVADSAGGSASSSSLSITIVPGPNAPPSLMGLLRDACTGLPITRGVVIGLQSASAVGLSGSVIRPPGPSTFGFFAYPTVAGGSYQLSIQASGYAPLGAASRAPGQPGLSLQLDESRTALPDGGALAEGLLLDLRLIPLNPPATGCRAALPPLFPAVSGRIVSNAGRGVANLGIELQTVNPLTGQVVPGSDAFGHTNRLGLFSLTLTNSGAIDEGQHQFVVYRAGRNDRLTVKLGDRTALSGPSGYQSLVLSLRLPGSNFDLAADPAISAIDVATTPYRPTHRS